MASEFIHRTHTTEPHEPISGSSRSFDPQRNSTNPILHMLQHRVPFFLIGVAIAALIFHTFPHSTETPIPVSRVDSEMALPSRRILFQERKLNVPRGLKRKSKRIVVIGGAGFVGSHLVDRLIERGDSVVVVDNFFTGRKENLVHHFGNPRFELIRHDVVEPILLEVGQIYRLACPASPVHYKFNPVKTIISSC